MFKMFLINGLVWVPLNPDYALGFRNEGQKANKIRCSTVILPRRRSHPYGEKQNRWTCLILKAFWIAIEILMHNSG
jgi:hypothetical protein